MTKICDDVTDVSLLNFSGGRLSIEWQKDRIFFQTARFNALDQHSLSGDAAALPGSLESSAGDKQNKCPKSLRLPTVEIS